VPPDGQEAPQHAEIMKLQSLYSGVRMFSENKEKKVIFTSGRLNQQREEYD
jgi:hypothetical protein